MTFIDQMAQVLPRYLDPDVIDVIEKLYIQKGVKLAFGWIDLGWKAGSPDRDRKSVV